LRTRETILPDEDCRLYSELWDELEADWQPQTRTERIYLETMVTSQWLLRRIAKSEQDIYLRLGNEAKFKMLAYVYKQRAQLERSFRTAAADMKQSHAERKAIQPPPPQSEQPAKPASAPAPLIFDNLSYDPNGYATTVSPPGLVSPSWTALAVTKTGSAPPNPTLAHSSPACIP
jgi:hypothetical protein